MCFYCIFGSRNFFTSISSIILRLRKRCLRIKFLELFEKIEKKKIFYILKSGCFWRAYFEKISTHKLGWSDTLSSLHQPLKIDFAYENHYSCWSSLTGKFQIIFKKRIEKQLSKICRASTFKCFKIATNGRFGAFCCRKFQVGEHMSNFRQRCSSYIFGFQIWPNPIFLWWQIF